MSFTYRAAGTLASGNNGTSLSPALPAGIAAGDLLVCQFQCFGGTNSRVPSMPADWEEIAVWANGTSRHGLWWKVATASESGPTLTLTGTGASNDTQLARIFAFTPGAGTTPVRSVTGSTSTNSSADNIGPVSGITPGSGDLVLLSCGKANDFNGTATLASWTLAEMSESTTGTDAGMALLYQLSSGGSATGGLTVTDNGGTNSNGVGLGLLVSFDEIAPASETLSDSIDLDDATGGVLPQPAQADTATLTDTLTETLDTGVVELDEALSDTATTGDALGRTVNVAAQTLADTATSSDTLGRTLNLAALSLADSVSVTDAVTPTLDTGSTAAERTLADTVAVTDAVGGGEALPVQGDTVTVADAMAIGWERVLAQEFASISDTLLHTLNALSTSETLSDSVTLTDQVGAVQRVVPHADTVTVTDALTETLTQAAVHRDEAIQEGATLSDALTRAVTVPLEDAVLLEDPAGFDLDFPPPSDTVTLSDALEETLNTDIALTQSEVDTVTLGDVLGQELALVQVLADTATLVDLVDERQEGVLVEDEADVDDSLDYLLGQLLGATDTATLTDAVDYEVHSAGVARIETLAELVAVAEFMQPVNLTQLPILAEPVMLTDALLATLLAPSEYFVTDLSGPALLLEDLSGPRYTVEDLS